MIKTFMRIGVGIGQTATAGKFLSKGHEKTGCASTSPILGTEQHGVELCKEWVDKQSGRNT
jgi:hypothetical protein